MTVFDRYLLKLFCKIFVICFFSFTGLFIVIHLFSHLDELMKASESAGGMGQLLAEFYLPRALDIFDRTAGVLVLVSAIFSISLMQRRREMTAVQASGIAPSRIVRPIVIASIIVICISIANRELVLPRFKTQLAQTVETWGNKGNVKISMIRDVATGLVIRGEELMIEQNKITNISVQLPLHLNSQVKTIQANWGVIQREPRGRQPAGLKLHQVSADLDMTKLNSVFDSNGNPVVYFPGDREWLAPRQCLVVCDLDVQELAFGKLLDQYKSTPELVQDLRAPRLSIGNSQQRVEVHSRILRPFLDITLLLLGLPLVVGRPDQNVFAAAGLCLVVVIGVQLTSLVCQNLGATSLIRPAALAAWLPVLIFLPFTVLSVRRINRSR